MELIIKNTNMKEGYPLFGLKDLSINKPTLSLEVEEVVELTETSRGEGGFGSTGV